MRTTLRRLLVGALFAFVGALLIDGTAHAQAGCTGPDPFAALGGGTCYKGGWFPPGMAIPGGGRCDHPVAGAERRLRHARRRTRSRRSAAGPATRAAGSRRAWQSPVAEVRPPRCRRQRRLRPARRRTRSRRSAAGPATRAAGSRRAWQSPAAEVRPPRCRRQRRLRPARRRTRSRRSAAGPATGAAGSRRAWQSPVAAGASPLPSPAPAAPVGMHDAGSVRGARRRDLLHAAAGSRRACRSRAAEARPRPNPL